MVAEPKVHVAAQTIQETVFDLLCSARWQTMKGDEHEQSWIMTKEVCQALNEAGIESIPSAEAVQYALDRHTRNEAIIRHFDGKNHMVLARRFGISDKTVRRVVEQHRAARRDE